MVNAANRAYARAHPELAKKWARQQRLRSRGWTLESWAAAYEAQGGICAVDGCEAEINAADHNHATGKRRELLCTPCNLALGLAQDDPKRLRALADYLDRHG